MEENLGIGVRSVMHWAFVLKLKWTR